MKKNIGIWLDFKQAFIITLKNEEHSIKQVESNIEFRERVEGETKKYGRFGGQFITYEKQRENKRLLQTNEFIKQILKELKKETETDFELIGGDRTSVSYFTFPDATEVTKYLPDGSDLSNPAAPTYGGSARDAGNDYIVLRFADVLLMHVEAVLAGGEATVDSGALASFRRIRDRAFPTTAPNAIASVTKEDLLRERRVELAFENQRYFDLVRFGVLDAVLSAHSAEMGYIYDSRKASLLPIPAREINISEGLLTQNPGY